MTGFASVGRETDAARVQVTLKSVNHRFLDLALKVPHACAGLEGRLRALVQRRVGRGRVELLLALEQTAPPARDVAIDEALLGRIAAAMAAARDRGLVTGDLTVSDVLRLPQVIDIRQPAAEAGVPEGIAALVEEAVDAALLSLVAMRETEGRLLHADFDARLQTMAGFVEMLRREARDGQQQLEGRLRERLAGLPPDLLADPAAVGQEVVRFVARSDIDEEIVRLESHLEHWRALVDGPEPCGRKLDFLVQEMNREVNTIGAKVEGARATAVVIDAKAELERLREQIQNVE